MAKAMVSFRDSQALSWLSGPRTDGPTKLPLIGPDYIIFFSSSSRSFILLEYKSFMTARDMYIHVYTLRL
jgi:hypothetical protein